MFHFLTETHNHESLDEMDLEELILERELDKENLYALENGFLASLNYGLRFAVSRKAAQLWYKSTGRYQALLEELREQIARDKEEIFGRGANLTQIYSNVQKLKEATTRQKWRDRRRYVLEQRMEHRVTRDVAEAEGRKFTLATMRDFFVYNKMFISAATALALGSGLYFGSGAKLQYDNTHRSINVVRAIEHEHPAVSASRATYNAAMLADDLWNFVNSDGLRSEPQLEGKAYKLMETIEESQRCLAEVSQFLQQFDASMKLISDGGKGVFDGWRYREQDNYHTEIRTDTYTDSEGNVHTDTYTVQVYDDTDFYWNYEPSITGRGAGVLKEGVILLSENSPGYISVSGLHLKKVPEDVLKEEGDLSKRQKKRLLADLNSWIEGSVLVRGTNSLASGSKDIVSSREMPFVEQNYLQFPRSYHINRSRSYYYDDEAPSGYIECKNISRKTTECGSTYFDLVSRVNTEQGHVEKLEQEAENAVKALGLGKNEKQASEEYKKMSETSIAVLKTLNDSGRLGRLSQAYRTLFSFGIGFFGLAGGAAATYFGLTALEKRNYTRRMRDYGVY